MARICANCSTTQGPFSTSWSEWAIPICKATKKEADRLSKCVARRAGQDLAKYKELMSSYE